MFQLLCQSSFFEVNLNVIAWPNHYKRGFVRIFSYKAGAVQGYLLCSFTEELIEVNLPQAAKMLPEGLDLSCSVSFWEVAVPYCDPGWLLSLPSVFQRHPCVWEGTRPGKWHIWHIYCCSGSLHSSSSLCDLSLHLSFYTVVFQMKNVSVLYLLARKCQVFSANDMKVLESEAKKYVLDYFLMCFFR